MTPREHVRELIRTEIARHNPIEDARRPLELIAESSVRLTEQDGVTRHQVVDEEGKPRTTVRDGRTVEVTLEELVAELRAQHPTLFNPPPGAVAETVPSDPGEPTLAVAAPASGGEGAKAGRDWLRLASGEAAEAALMPGPPRLRDTEPAAAPAPAAQAASRWHAHHALGALAGLAGVLILVLALAPAPQAPDREAAGRRPGLALPSQADPATTGTVPAKPEAAAAPVPLAGVPEVIDTGTLRIEGKVVRLFGIEWARGAQGEDLARYLGGRSVGCRPAAGTDLYRCEVEGHDLSEVVLYNGGGRATSEAPPELVAAETRARSERLGVWRK